MENFLDNLLYIFQRLDWLSVLDILLVTLIFFAVLYSLRDTQAMVLMRGVIFLVVTLVLFTTLVELPSLLLACTKFIASIIALLTGYFAEIRRALNGWAAQVGYSL
jgi:diadenylate cyclase